MDLVISSDLYQRLNQKSHNFERPNGNTQSIKVIIKDMPPYRFEIVILCLSVISF